MDAGRELDARVAEKVMGFRRCTMPAGVNGERGGNDVLVPPGVDHETWVYPPKGEIPIDFFVPDYSTRLEDAWRVLERLGGEVGVSAPGGSGDCFASLGRRPGELARFRTAKTVPVAICLAALEHVGAL